MKNVNFYYKQRPSVRVLRNMNLHCPPGSKVALVGPSGSGKSTCASLMTRLYDPVSGTVVSISNKCIQNFAGILLTLTFD